MRKSCHIGFILLLLVSGCGNESKTELPRSRFPNDGTGLPLPRFDTAFDQLLVSLEEKFKAEDVQISRPFEFNLNGKPQHWLKVYLLNPEIIQVGDDPFGVFAEEVAATVYRHITNSDKFKKLEITVEQQVPGFSSVMSKVICHDHP